MNSKVCVSVEVSLLILLVALGVRAQQRPASDREGLKEGPEQVTALPESPSQTVQAPREALPSLIVPRLIKFAGTLRDAQGNALNNAIGVTFGIYKDQLGGAALWLETQNVQPDEQGRYSVLLGATRNEGLPLELFSSGEPRWLGWQVQLPGEVEQPRVLLVSVPYALKAADAESLGGKPASAYMLAPEGVPAVDTGGTGGSDTVTGPVQTKNRVTARGGKATPQLITANFLPVFTDNNGTLGTRCWCRAEIVWP